MKRVLFCIAVLFGLMLGRGLGGAEPLQPALSTADAGRIRIELWQDGGWQPVADAGFSPYHQQQSVILPDSDKTSEPLRLRLTQTGGKAAYMDAVLLNGVPASRIEGFSSQKAISKLSRKDNDLMDISGRRFEAEFAKAPEGKPVLQLTAKIVPEKISPLPLRYPEANGRLPLGQARFFYRLKAAAASRDGLQTFLATRPVIREYSNTGSGHPGGLLAAWVEQDEQNLLVTVDFTQDNTEDGDDDYMELYLRNAHGVKTFRITASQNRWGRVIFARSPNADYEHKIYRFSIPLRDASLSKGEAVQLALAAYGTVAMPLSAPGMAFDSNLRRYLLVFSKYDLVSDNLDLKGLFVDEDGRAMGSEFVINRDLRTISAMLPRVAYNSVDGGFLVVWDEQLPDEEQISVVSQLLGENGQRIGRKKKISPSSLDHIYPDVAYNSFSNSFFVVWMSGNSDYMAEYWNILGQRVNARGLPTLPAAVVFEGDTDTEAVLPRICADEIHNQYLVTWTRWSYGATAGAGFRALRSLMPLEPAADIEPYDIYGQRVSTNGSLLGNVVALANTDKDAVYPYPVFNPLTSQFFVVWFEMGTDYNNSIPTATLKCRLFGATLSPDGESRSMDQYDGYMYFITHAAAFDRVRNRYLTVWNNMAVPGVRPQEMAVDETKAQAPGIAIYGIYTDAQGNSGSKFSIGDAEQFKLYPELEANPLCGNFLCGFSQGLYYDALAFGERMPDIHVGYELVGKKCPTEPEVVTGPLVSVGYDHLTLKGSVTVFDELAVRERGFCWSEMSPPTLEDAHLAVGSGPGEFQALIENLEPLKRYYIRAYADYTRGMAYGNELLVLVKPQYTVTFIQEGQGQLQGELTQLVSEHENCSPVGAFPAVGWYFGGWMGLRSGDDQTANPLLLRDISAAMTAKARFLSVSVSVQSVTVQGWVLRLYVNRILIEMPDFGDGRPARIVVLRSQNGGEFTRVATLAAGRSLEYLDSVSGFATPYVYRLILQDENGQEIGRSQDVIPE